MGTQDKHKLFLKELKELMLKHNVYIGVDIEGDTHGTTENFIIADRAIFEGNRTVIKHYSSYLYPSDIELDTDT